jgi:hypothetical protein
VREGLVAAAHHGPPLDLPQSRHVFGQCLKLSLEPGPLFGRGLGLVVP